MLRVEGISSSSKCFYEDYEEGGHGHIGPRRKEDIVVGHGYCLEGSKSHYTKDYAKKVEKQPIEKERKHTVDQSRREEVAVSHHVQHDEWPGKCTLTTKP